MENKVVSISKAFRGSITHFDSKKGPSEALPLAMVETLPIAQERLRNDASGNPSEWYNWTHYGRVMAERRTELGYPYINPLEPTLAEMLFHERITRKELGYDL